MGRLLWLFFVLAEAAIATATMIVISAFIFGRSILIRIFSLAPVRCTLLGTVVFPVFWVYAVFPFGSSFQALIIVYTVLWLLTGGMVAIYYLLQNRKLFAEKSMAEPA